MKPINPKYMFAVNGVICASLQEAILIDLK
jgi:hypothetical protein